jgi:hypothetical protein
MYRNFAVLSIVFIVLLQSLNIASERLDGRLFVADKWLRKFLFQLFDYEFVD